MAFSPVSRRSFLRHIPLAAAAAGTLVSGAAVAQPVMVRVGSPSMSVPPDAWAAIQKWAAAHRASVAATKAYADYLRPIGERRHVHGGPIYPAEKAECDRLFEASVEAASHVGPAREHMIVALLKATQNT